jgi:RNA recognition motif-containing protein
VLLSGGIKLETASVGVNNGCLLFVGNMSPRITEGELRAIVEPFGLIRNVNMQRAYAIDASCAFAFVEMTDERAAARAIVGLNGKSVDGRCLKVRLGF